MTILQHSIVPSSGYLISRSLRFNSPDSAYLNRTPAGAGNQKTYTISFWVKRVTLSSQKNIFATNAISGALFTISFESDNTFRSYYYNGSAYVFHKITSQVFRDVSAWYHLVLAVDTTQATASNRVKMYVNGVQISAFSTSVDPSQNADTDWNSTKLSIINASFVNGVNQNSYGDLYLTEIYNIDGQALTPSSFGQTNPSTGVWQPIKYTGTYGTNGFYLNFSDNSGTTATTLGKDYSGNGNNWTPNNFSVTAGAGNDSLVDTPTPYGSDTGAGGEVRGNYCTLNPLSTSSLITASNGNLNASSNQTVSTGYRINSTFSQSSGKWYFEVTNTSGSNTLMIGVGQGQITNQFPGADANSWAYHTSGLLYNNGSTTSTTSASSVNDVIGVAFDIDAGKIWFSVNGTFVGSGNPSAGTNPAFTGLSGSLTQMVRPYGTNNADVNFGQRPFAYTAPSGFKALCTQNLPTPTIGATSTTQAGKYFNTVIWTGDGNNPRTVSGVGFQPDFVWAKLRSGTASHTLYDAVRGVGNVLYSDLTAAEANNNAFGYLSAFNSDGFVASAGSTSNAYFNTLNSTYVSWNWNAGGSNATNTSGTITSTVRANTTAGFSIVTYTGNLTAAGNATVGHGLGVAPDLIITKARSGTSRWAVQMYKYLTANNYLELNTTAAQASWGAQTRANPTSTLFDTIYAVGVNENGITYVAYCFAAVAGYSAFGSYTGNGSADGPFIYLGFRPKYILFKSINGTNKSWWVEDIARDPYNVAGNVLAPNLTDAEATGQNNVDFLSNGFKLRSNWGGSNTNAEIYIYAAFAESPFKYSLAR